VSQSQCYKQLGSSSITEISTHQRSAGVQHLYIYITIT